MKEKELEEIKNKFVNLECVKNRKIKLTDVKETTVIVELSKCLGISIPPKLTWWINNNLICVWGNKSYKCKGHSDKIFEILNEIMKKLKES